MLAIAGPEQLILSEAAHRYLYGVGNSREVVTNAQTRYFGTLLAVFVVDSSEKTLTMPVK